MQYFAFFILYPVYYVEVCAGIYILIICICLCICIEIWISVCLYFHSYLFLDFMIFQLSAPSVWASPTCQPAPPKVNFESAENYLRKSKIKCVFVHFFDVCDLCDSLRGAEELGNFSILRLISLPIYPTIHPDTHLGQETIQKY